MKTPLSAILLAAGKGTRMKSCLPKVLHEIAGKPLMSYPLALALQLKCKPIVAVVGHEAKLIQKQFESNPAISFALQTSQLGSAHAVLCAEKALKNFTGDVLILSGDVPLLTCKTLERILTLHQTEKNALTIGSFKTNSPTGYGRILRDSEGRVLKIIEETDLSEAQRKISEVNGGLYVAKADLLFKTLKEVKKNSVKNEYYFTDLVALLSEKEMRVGACILEDSSELMGVNTRVELAQAEEKMQERLQKKWMLSGVTFLAPHRTAIHTEVRIESDTVIHPDVALLGKTKIGKECVLEQGVILQDTVLKNRVTIRAYSNLEKSLVEDDAVIGPFARLRPETQVGKNCRVGNFVELKKTKLGEGSKANHLSYLGDAVIGKAVNVGAGTITCNYDGVHKFKTKIEDGAFIGSDTQLVAPVKVGKKAYVGAGTTVTKNVPEGALAVSRVEQKNIVGYSRNKK